MSCKYKYKGVEYSTDELIKYLFLEEYSLINNVVNKNTSKVVDTNGQPLVVHHTTSTDFTEFDKKFIGQNYTPKYGKGFYFADSLRGSNEYGNKKTLHTFLNIKNLTKSTYKLSVDAKDNNLDTSEYAKTEGYDGLFAGDEYAKQYVAFEPNQIKSATENIGTFDVNNNDINFLVVGEQGAEALDRAEEATIRLDNLRVAKEMETAEKSPKEIRLATGWERGADKKWRYEIEDNFELAEIPLYVKNPYGYNRTLDLLIKKEYLVIPDESGRWNNVTDISNILTAYPMLKNTAVSVRGVMFKGEGDNASYMFDDKTKKSFININLKEGTDIYSKDAEKRIKSLLLHELQHAVQLIEGFANGGSEKQFSQNKIDLYIERYEKRHNELLSTDENDLSGAEKLELVRLNSYKEEVIKDIEANAKIGTQTKNAYYQRLAGEVEARNVEKRLNYTPEQRRNTLLSETEDVSREDQIFLMDNLGGDMMSLQSRDGQFVQGNTTIYYKERINPITGKSTNEIEIDKIETPKEFRGKGNARQALQTLMKQLGRNLYLIAKPLDTLTSESKLIKFYESLGFRSNPFLPQEMTYRAPRRIAQQTATNKTTTKLVTEYLQRQLGYDINILSLSDMNEEVKKRGYGSLDSVEEENKFKDSNEVVYGFYDPATNQIYMTEDFLNSNTLIHEAFHKFEPVLEAQALKGDEIALKTLDKLRNLAYDFLGGKDKVKEIISRRQTTTQTTPLSFLYVNNKANLNVVERKQLVDAIALFESGLGKDEIFKLTNWYFDNKEGWLFETKNDLTNVIKKLKENNGQPTTVRNLLEGDTIFNYVSNLDIKVEFKDSDSSNYNPISRVIKVNKNQTNEEIAKDIYHETQHAVAWGLGMDGGGTAKVYNQITRKVIEQARERIGGGLADTLRSTLSSAGNILYARNKGEQLAFDTQGRVDDTSRKNAPLVLGNELTKYIEGNVDEVKLLQLLGLIDENGVSYGMYELQEKFNLSYQDLISDSQNLDFQIVGEKGATTQSPFNSAVYDRRNNETDEMYEKRLLGEAMARILGNNSDEYFERIAKENGLNENETKSFIERIKQFIKDFSDWLKNQLGLTDITAEQFASMTNKEVFDMITTSMLRGDFDGVQSKEGLPLFMSKAQEYFTRNADRLPLTLAVFQRPEFISLQGKMVNPITILNSLNQSGIKQIEKDLIKQVITDNFSNNEQTTITSLGEPRGDRRRWNPSRGNQTLEGAPINTKRENVTGADPELTYWAEEYAKRNGIDYKRQSKYVEVDTERAERIAQEYDKMEHNPKDPKVKEAYDNLIKQTIAQYNILVEAGYQFYFFDETNDPYDGNPMAAMEELRNKKQMGSFSTEAGFGTGNEGLDVSNNPMLQDTGIEWGWGSIGGEKRRVLANDVFRAVHDAFGHGLEGAGFRARGEENAWQAHARLFTGSARAAITSETRGQNSWLNFGKYAEQNRNAKVADTIFAPQKTGLMPEWTWQEGFDAGQKTVKKDNKISYDELEATVRANIMPLEYKMLQDILNLPKFMNILEDLKIMEKIC